MPILNGEKYACESCIKGHRVSGCTHSDRPLKHINPKGRPVKQCEHCQKARKTKSHHARCDCGTKKDKAKAEKAAAAAAAAAASASESEHDAHASLDTALSFPGGSQGCACHQGEKCVCGLKKEDLKVDTTFLKNAQLNKNKPRLTTAHSETTLTVFANGHHKPCHRLNNSAHTSGAPYRIPRHHPTHGSTVHRSHDNLAEMYSRTMDPARRSVDSLNLTNNAFGYFTPQTSADSVPMTPLTGSLENDSSMFDPSKFVYNQQSALSKMVGETTEPHGLPMSESMPVHTYSWMNGMYPPAPQYGVESISTSPTGDLTPDFDYNIPSAAADMTSNPYPWSAGDLPLDPNKLSDSLQPVSHSGESNRQSVPGMTTSSSGAQSEVGEPALFGDMDLNKMQQEPSVSDQQLMNDPFQMRDPQSYRLSSASLSQQDVRQQMATSVPTNEPRQSLDLDFMQGSQDNNLMGQTAVFGTSALDNQAMFQTTSAASSGFSDATFTAADFTGTLNAPQSGIDATAPPEAQGTDWYNILGTGMGVNAFSVPIETMNSQNAEFPTWL